eukprot:s387_g10.t1
METRAAGAARWEVLVKQATGQLVSAYLQGATPAVGILHSAILETASARHWRWALHFFVAAPRVVTPSSHAAIEALLGSLAAVKKWALNLQLFEELYSEGHDFSVDSFHDALSCCKLWGHGSWAYAEILLEQMGSVLLQLGPGHPTVEASTASVLCDATSEQRELQQGDLHLWKDIQPDQLFDQLFEQSEEWQAALAIFCQMPDHTLDHSIGAYSAMISACEKGCQWQRALHLHGQMKRRRNVVSLSSCISALEKGRQWQKAERLLESMLQEWSWGAGCFFFSLDGHE